MKVIFMDFLNTIKDAIAPKCSLCSERIIFSFNYKSDLIKLKIVNEYIPSYNAIKDLCHDCWIKIITMPCGICHQKFDVLQDEKNKFQENLNLHRISIPTLINAKHVCPECCDKHHYVRCAHCQKSFLSKDDKNKSYNDSIEANLLPYGKSFNKTSKPICPDSLKQAKIAGKKSSG